MTDVALVYPYVDPPRNRSIFRFPPLGLGYIAAHLRDEGHSVQVVDATFTGEDAAVEKTRALRPRVIGVYSMFTMREASLRFARALRGDCELIVAGGPPPHRRAGDLPPRLRRRGRRRGGADHAPDCSRG